MKKSLTIMAVLLFLYAVPCGASDPFFISDEVISVLATGTTGFTVPAKATKALVSVALGDTVMWRIGNPTTRIGHPLTLNSYVAVNDERDLRRFRATVRAGGSGASLFVSYYGY